MQTPARFVIASEKKRQGKRDGAVMVEMLCKHYEIYEGNAKVISQIFRI